MYNGIVDWYFVISFIVAFSMYEMGKYLVQEIYEYLFRNSKNK